MAVFATNLDGEFSCAANPTAERLNHESGQTSQKKYHGDAVGLPDLMVVNRKLRDGIAAAIGAIVAVLLVLVAVAVNDDDSESRTATTTDRATTTVEPSTTTKAETSTTSEPATTTKTETPTTSEQASTEASDGEQIEAPTAAGAGEPVTSSASNDSAPANVLFMEDFSSADGMSRLTFQIHDEAAEDLGEGWNEIHQFNGDHNLDCDGPPTTRPLTQDLTLATHVWHCTPKGDPTLGHFMTGMNTGNYVSIAFAPTDADGVITFPATANKVCWDMNSTNLGNRKWTQLVVVSGARFDANDENLTYVNPEFEGNAPSQIQLADGDFMFVDVQSTTRYYSGRTRTMDDGDAQHDVTDKAARFQTCIRDNGDGTVTRTQQRAGGLYSVTGTGSFPAGPRVFILQDESYNPTKAEPPAPVSDAFTWHWDNVTVSED